MKVFQKRSFMRYSRPLKTLTASCIFIQYHILLSSQRNLCLYWFITAKAGTPVRVPKHSEVGWFGQALVVSDLLRRLSAALPGREGTRDPLYISSVILLGSFLIPVTFVTYLYGRLPAWDVPLPALAACFVWGGTIGTILAGTLEYDLLHRMGLLPLLGIGLIEESAKLVFPLILYFLGRYRSEADGIILGVSTAVGFVALETMGYSFVAFL